MRPTLSDVVTDERKIYRPTKPAVDFLVLGNIFIEWGDYFHDDEEDRVNVGLNYCDSYLVSLDAFDHLDR